MDPTAEQREAIELINEWKTNLKVQCIYGSFGRFLAAVEPDEESERREGGRQKARAARLNTVVQRTEPRPLTEREQAYLERVNQTNPLR